MTASVLLLRAPLPGDALVFLLEEEGIEPAFYPLLEVTPPDDLRGARAALEHIGRFHWVLPDAPMAVRAMSELAHSAGTRKQLAMSPFIAPDHETARALGQLEWMPRILLPPLEPLDGVLDALRNVVQENDETLVLSAEGIDRPWSELLREAGARVSEAKVWKPSPVPAVPDGAKVVVVHSPAVAEAFVKAVPAGRFDSAKFVALGPATAHALKHLGVTVWATAPAPTADAALDATLRALSE